MKNQFKAALLGLFVAGSVQAITISDNNPADTWINALNPSYTGTFTLSPYNPLTQQVNSAFVEFLLWDGLLSETWTMTLDGGAFSSGGSFSGYFSFGGGVTGSALLTLSDTGALSYTISRGSGEFWLKNAYLEAEVGPRAPGGPTGVPDGGSAVLLLSLGLGALAAARRFLTVAA